MRRLSDLHLSRRHSSCPSSSHDAISGKTPAGDLARPPKRPVWKQPLPRTFFTSARMTVSPRKRRSSARNPFHGNLLRVGGGMPGWGRFPLSQRIIWTSYPVKYRRTSVATSTIHPPAKPAAYSPTPCDPYITWTRRQQNLPCRPLPPSPSTPFPILITVPTQKRPVQRSSTHRLTRRLKPTTTMICQRSSC